MTRRQRIEDLTTLALPGEDDATHWQRRLAIDEGLLDLDAPLAEVLPELRLADPDVTGRVTRRRRHPGPQPGQHPGHDRIPGRAA
jgi:hypothetical protein